MNESTTPLDISGKVVVYTYRCEGEDTVNLAGEKNTGLREG